MLRYQKLSILLFITIWISSDINDEKKKLLENLL